MCVSHTVDAAAPSGGAAPSGPSGLAKRKTVATLCNWVGWRATQLARVTKPVVAQSVWRRRG